MPDVRPAYRVLEEFPNGTGLLFWRVLVDVDLSRLAEDSPGLFASSDAPLLEFAPAEIKAPLQELLSVAAEQSSTLLSKLPAACTSVWEWAQQRDRPETALQFAELAARLTPEAPGSCSVAGQFCRLRGETHRGAMWYRRASRLARRQENEVEFSRAQIGLGSLAVDVGALAEAQAHYEKGFKAALRCGRHSLAGWAFHDLVLLKIGQEAYDEAWVHAKNALSIYKREHPRFPALAHDIALLWSRMGYFSAAMPIFERVLPLMARGYERLIILSNLARAAAACGDRMRYERAIREFLRVHDEGGTIPPSSWVHAAYAAHTCGDWERAERLITLSLEHAHSGYVDMSNELARSIAVRAPGDQDIIPDAGSEIDVYRDLILRRLTKHTVPGWGPGTMPPEKFPLR
jgi:tetratricopeptide (TPR) repeat protein